MHSFADLSTDGIVDGATTPSIGARYFQLPSGRRP
jgi:hypothetical protein